LTGPTEKFLAISIGSSTTSVGSGCWAFTILVGRSIGWVEVESCTSIDNTICGNISDSHIFTKANVGNNFCRKFSIYFTTIFVSVRDNVGTSILVDFGNCAETLGAWALGVGEVVSVNGTNDGRGGGDHGVVQWGAAEAGEADMRVRVAIVKSNASRVNRGRVAFRRVESTIFPDTFAGLNHAKLDIIFISESAVGVSSDPVDVSLRSSIGTARGDAVREREFGLSVFRLHAAVLGRVKGTFWVTRRHLGERTSNGSELRRWITWHRHTVLHHGTAFPVGNTFTRGRNAGNIRNAGVLVTSASVHESLFSDVSHSVVIALANIRFKVVWEAVCTSRESSSFESRSHLGRPPISIPSTVFDLLRSAEVLDERAVHGSIIVTHEETRVGKSIEMVGRRTRRGRDHSVICVGLGSNAGWVHETIFLDSILVNGVRCGITELRHNKAEGFAVSKLVCSRKFVGDVVSVPGHDPVESTSSHALRNATRL
jgi:hypothetical protein